MRAGIQRLVYEIIKSAITDFGKSYINRGDIIMQVKRTSYGKMPDNKLIPAIERALYQLHKVNTQNRIISKGYGRWSLPAKNTSRMKYKPKVCRAIQKTEKGDWYCPVKQCYICNPREQCELLHGVNLKTMTKQAHPMQPCYFSSKPTEDEIVMMQQKLTEMEQPQQHIIRGF